MFITRAKIKGEKASTIGSYSNTSRITIIIILKHILKYA
jgi:hypothetical protein